MPMLTQIQPATANVPSGQSGVPSTWSAVATDAAAFASVELDTLLQSYLIEQVDKQWGIFDDSNFPALTSSRVRAVEINRQYNVTDAPTENGAFLSYNKVKIPMQIVLEVLCDGTTMSYGGIGGITSMISAFTGGPTADQKLRTEFLKSLDNLVPNLNAYRVVTPEAVYWNMNAVGYNLRRATDRGISLLYVDVLLKEIRNISSATYTQTAQPQGLAQQNSGNVQSQPPTSAQLIAAQAGVV